MSQFNSVAQFYQCIVCFAIPLLIVQQGYLWLRSVDKRYQQIRYSLYQKQNQWTEKTLLEREIGKSANESQQKQNQGNTQKIQQVNQQSQRPARSQPEQQKTEQIRQKSNSRDSNGQRKSRDSKDNENQNEEQNRRITLPEMDEIEKTRKSQQSIDVPSKHKQPVFIKQESRVEEHRQKPPTVQQQEKLQRAIRYIMRIDVAFEQYMPIIISVLVMGILTHSVYVFSMVCFFGYAFSSLLFNYADLLSKLRRGLVRSSIFAKLNYLFSGFFIIALFVSYFIDNQYNLTD